MAALPPPTAADAFGDAPLANQALAPLSLRDRCLTKNTSTILWIAVGFVPGAYTFACGRFSVFSSIVSVMVGTAVAAVTTSVLARGAPRYGIGYVVLLRAPFGCRGAPLFAALRWLIGVAWTVASTLELARWSAALALALLQRHHLIGPITDGHAAPALSWGLGLLLILQGANVARVGLPRIIPVIVVASLGAIVAGLVLIIYAGVASRGFGSWLTRHAEPLSTTDMILAPLAVSIVGVATLISVPDWLRFVRLSPPKSSRPLARRRTSPSHGPLVAAVAAGMLAFVGALLAAASLAVRQRLDSSPIPDAAGYGGALGGLIAVTFALCLWFATVPLIGFFSPALALSGTWPRRLGYSEGLLGTVIAAVLMLPFWGGADAQGIGLGTLALAFGAPVGVMLVDELLLRRGHLFLEDLYLANGVYGPTMGFCLAGLCAASIGWMFQLTLWPQMAERLVPALVRARPYQSIAPIDVVGFLIGLAVAAAAYTVFRPLERGVASAVRGGNADVLGADDLDDLFIYDDRDATPTSSLNPILLTEGDELSDGPAMEPHEEGRDEEG